MNEERDFNSEPVSTNDAPDTSGGALLQEQRTQAGGKTEIYHRGDSAELSESTNEGSQYKGDDGDSGQGNVYTAREEGVKVEVRDEGKELDLESKGVILEDYVSGALREHFLSFNAISIKRDYPKAYKKLWDYMQSKSSSILLDEETMIASLLYAPRNVLYSFFDEQELFVNTIGKHTSWESILNDETSQASFTSRVYAEFDGFHKAFEELNKK